MSMFSSRLASVRMIALLSAILALGGAGEDVAVATIPAFNQVFGVPPGQPDRPVHTKGVLVRGTFRATPQAAALTRAAQFAGPPVPVLVRLSNFPGLQENSDAAPEAAPHGLAIKFALADGSDTDLVAHSYNGFPAATPGVFLDFLHALADAASGPPGEGPLDRFLAGHPQARLFIETPKPPPASWANESFYGVNTFHFVDPFRHGHDGRYMIKPVDGDLRLTPAQAALAAPDYLRRNLSERLDHGPVRWRLIVQLADPTDDLLDGSKPWPQTRATVEMGILEVTAIVPETDAAQRDLMFSPLNLVDGIEPSGDPMLAARSRAYGASFRLRSR